MIGSRIGVRIVTIGVKRNRGRYVILGEDKIRIIEEDVVGVCEDRKLGYSLYVNSSEPPY